MAFTSVLKDTLISGSYTVKLSVIWWRFVTDTSRHTEEMTSSTVIGRSRMIEPPNTLCVHSCVLDRAGSHRNGRLRRYDPLDVAIGDDHGLYNKIHECHRELF